MFPDDPQPHLAARQLWNLPTETTSQTQAHCTPFTLPSNGVIQLGDSSAITLTTDVIFQPECTGTQAGETFPIGYLRDPFYASTIPMVYVIAAATVIAWVLVVMLTITPRTSFFGLPNTAPAFTNGHGIIGGANGGISGLSGSGSRPWLQKVAAILVAISLTIATADTLEVAQDQYYAGYMDAGDMRKQVLGSLEIRITRVISDIFLWLAQVQTLIRLFPRHKEKVLIKWIGFVLIILDTVFSCLNSFLINSQPRGRHFVDAIPALSYLFELALGLLYAAWVMYYSLTKRRYSYYHAKMRSISLIALLSLVSILTPVVFFITDVSNQDVAGWGDYFRWVGAAAAAVVVWEWVERIEALERDDKKDGILGREVFDGDEMLDVMPSEEAAWTQSRNLRRNFRRPGGNDDPGGGNQQNMVEQGLSGVANRFRQRHQQSPQHFPLGRTHSNSEPNSSSDQQARTDGRAGTVTFDNQIRPSEQRRSNVLGGPTPPPPIASPVSRDESNSAASTVYVVRYHPVADVPQPIRRRNQQRKPATQPGKSGEGNLNEKDIIEEDEDETNKNRHREQSRWLSVPNPFKRKRTSPPQEVQRARVAATGAPRSTTPASSFANWDLRSRIGTLANDTGGRLRDRTARRKPEAPLPVTVIPAQPRGSGRTWSPDGNAIVTSPAPESTPAPMQASASATEEQDPRISNGTTSTTLTSASQQAQRQFVSTPQPMPPRAEDFSPSHPVTARSTASPGSARIGPPRADDISPVNRRVGTVVVPAPSRRSPQETPSRNNTSSAGSGPAGSHRHTPSNG